MRLLLAEDEQELSKALTAILKHNHYEVDAVFNGQDALDYAMLNAYDGIILDIMMPKKSGLEVLQTLRAQGNHTPILLLTAKAEVEDRIAGLDTGADDYLTKPFAMGELLARIRTMTRRKALFQPNTIVFGDAVLDCTAFTLTGPNGTVRLSGKEFQMLEMMMRSPGCPISTERFMEHIWGCDSESDSSVVWTFVSTLRKRLAASGAHVAIRAARGQGYTLEEQA